jgi:chemotaxis protein methyltransferase CheR
VGLLTRLSDREYGLISQLVYDKFGINLGEQKRALIVGRLNKVLHQNGFSTFEEYYNHLIKEQTGEALKTLVDRISTNHTFFWRENDHFDYLVKTVLPEISATTKNIKNRSMKIWCSGCSSGEEPYTLAMLLQEYYGHSLSSWDMGILATDISSQALDKAIKGVYLDENVSKLPAHLRSAYFKNIGNDQLEVVPQLKSMIMYRRLNLIADNYPFKNKFNIIFCRNVMIYFDKPTREALLARYSRYMVDGGYLFIGHSESLGRVAHDFVYVKPAVYRKRMPQ